jgi:selenide,water dikinase
LDSPDDAAVWQINQDMALIATTDFFTPVVDDPYDYGAIAAANSLSDVYAMGGKPFLALNTAAMPPDLPVEIVQEIIRGGAEKAHQAGVVIAGGHTIQDKEPKYGLVVLGFVHPQKVMTKHGARVGDVLVLTKPLGFGTTTTALKQGRARDEDVREVIDWMSRLNQQASELALEFRVRGATDITGFGLLGHAWEMADASGVGMRFEWKAFPFTSSAHRYAADFIFPGGAYDNLRYFKPHTNFEANLSEQEQLLLFDPQTSGGIMFALPGDKVDRLLARAEVLNQPVWQVGEVIQQKRIDIY